MKLTARETVDVTRRALGDRYHDLRFITRAEAEAAGARRARMLAALKGRAASACKGSKPFLGGLSPGCNRCGRGEWSCLFVGFDCSAGCFFCPGDPPEVPSRAHPTADGLVFETPAAFADYVGRMGITAVAFSGGDPLLSLERVLDHLRELRRTVGSHLFVWLYTNGLAATAARLRRLREAGLDEIRINIAAVDYSLDGVELAKRIFDRVTVEIPAIPEDRHRVREVLPEMARIGVAHVNLHQLMLIGNNHGRIRDRGYVLSHGPTPSVVESELAALELMQGVADAGLKLSIQYCATAFKARWLVRAQSARINPHVMGVGDGETETGLVRRSWVEADPVELIAVAMTLAGCDPEGRRWRPDGSNRRIFLDRALFGAVASRGHSIRVAYLKAQPVPGGETSRVDLELGSAAIALDGRPELGAVLLPVSPVMALAPDEARRLQEHGWIPAVEKFEYMPSGLPRYV